MPLTVWRYEDYPYIWREVVQVFSSILNSQELSGSSVPVSTTITLKDAQLLNKYIEDQPPRAREDFEYTTQTFMKKISTSPNEIVGPDWPPGLVQKLVNNYEDDWYHIKRMEGVETVQPRQFG